MLRNDLNPMHHHAKITFKHHGQQEIPHKCSYRAGINLTSYWRDGLPSMRDLQHGGTCNPSLWICEDVAVSTEVGTLVGVLFLIYTCRPC